MGVLKFAPCHYPPPGNGPPNFRPLQRSPTATRKIRHTERALLPKRCVCYLCVLLNICYVLLRVVKFYRYVTAL